MHQNRLNNIQSTPHITGFDHILLLYNMIWLFLKQLTASLVGTMGGFSSVKQPNPSFNNYKFPKQKVY